MGVILRVLQWLLDNGVSVCGLNKIQDGVHWYGFMNKTTN